jgi:protein SCO1/2
MKFLLALSLFLVAAVPVRAEDRLRLEDVGFDQRIDQQVPLETTFRDESGAEVRLRDLFRGQPVILVLAYYQCPRLCNEVLNGLVDGLRGLDRFDVGRDFTVVTVSFDPRETAAMARAKRQAYVTSYGRPGAESGWHFLTGAEASIRELAGAVGFRYVYDAGRQQYLHASGIVVLTPAGKTYRYLYGIRYDPVVLERTLVEASENRLGTIVDQVLLLCYGYDAATGRYTLLVMNVVRLGGIVTVLTLGTFVFVMWRRDRRKKRAASPGQGTARQ